MDTRERFHNTAVVDVNISAFVVSEAWRVPRGWIRPHGSES